MAKRSKVGDVLRVSLPGGAIGYVHFVRRVDPPGAHLVHLSQQQSSDAPCDLVDRGFAVTLVDVLTSDDRVQFAGNERYLGQLPRVRNLGRVWEDGVWIEEKQSDAGTVLDLILVPFDDIMRLLLGEPMPDFLSMWQKARPIRAETVRAFVDVSPHKAGPLSTELRELGFSVVLLDSDDEIAIDVPRAEFESGLKHERFEHLLAKYTATVSGVEIS